MSNLRGSTLAGQRESNRDFKAEPNNAKPANSANKAAGAQAGLKNKSFAQQMAALNSKANETRDPKLQQQIEEFDPTVDLDEEEFAKLPDDLKSLYLKERQKRAQRQQSISSNNVQEAPDETQVMEQSQQKLSQQQKDAQRAMQQSQGQDAAQMQEIDEDSIYESKQESIAHAAQDKQEQVNQAAQQQQQQNTDDQRQQQLAHWQILAPRILEDGKNKAIRLDIPDVEDVKTIIVKMRGSSVDIQAIGSKDLVSIFKTKEGMLRSTLAKKNIRMGSSRVLDAAAIYGA